MSAPMTPIARLAAELAAGSTTSRALVETALARIDDPAGEGKRVMLKVHREAALAAAEASDALRERGHVPSPLAGLPVSIKDLYDIAGDVTTAAAPVMRDEPAATSDAAAVARLRQAGAVVIGRTNMTEFAYSGLGLNPHYDTPRNPWDRATGRIPGGSSAGAAVSVSDGMAAFALGSDTGGSVRIPASLCGLTGFKPTTRRVPMDGAFPLSTTLDSAGPLAPRVACCAVIDAVLAGEPPAVPAPFPLAGLRLAVPQTLVLDRLDEAVTRDFERALGALSRAGARITEIPFKELAEVPRLNAKGGIYAEAYAIHRERLDTDADGYDPRVASRIARVKDLSAWEYYDVLRAREALIKDADVATAPFDAVLTPTTAIVAPPIAAFDGDDKFYGATNLLMLRNTFCFNFLDRCALTLPMHRPGDAPTGLMVVGETMSDRRLLSIGLAIEAALL